MQVQCKDEGFHTYLAQNIHNPCSDFFIILNLANSLSGPCIYCIIQACMQSYLILVSLLPSSCFAFMVGHVLLDPSSILAFFWYGSTYSTSLQDIQYQNLGESACLGVKTKFCIGWNMCIWLMYILVIYFS